MKLICTASKVSWSTVGREYVTENGVRVEDNDRLMWHFEPHNGGYRLKVDGHSQLSDAFRAGFRYARRTTPQPAPVVPDELKEAAADFLTVLDEYPEQLVPINRDSAVVRALRAAMLNQK